MIGKLTALIQVPNQRLFSVKAAAKYLGIHEQTLRKLTDLRKIQARRMGSRRVFKLEELDHFIDSLPSWCDYGLDENPRIPSERREV